jgi:single-strand DNA-binding protein
MIMQNNSVKMVVNLGTKPTIKTVTGGRKMARFSAEAGTNKKKIKWYSVVSWGTLADMAERCLEKGKRVMIYGHLITNTWTDKNGVEQTKKEIMATHFILVNKNKQTALPLAA